MERARIGIFDDKLELRGILKEYLEMVGHRVVLEAGSVEEANQVIESLDPDSLDVILLDGNFTPGEIYSYEGSQIARLLRERFDREISIVDISAAYPISDQDVDAHIDKGKFDQLLGYIDGLEA